LRARGALVAELGQRGLGLPADFRLAGRTTVREAACVLHQAQALVSCDCGLMHLALAAGTPVVALFGPTDPDILVRNHPGFVPLRSTLECHGYWNRMAETPDPERCPLDHDCCLSSIGVEEVLDALTRGIGLGGMR
jgi:ADP-heptose:LPS heptosyltransferase